MLLVIDEEEAALGVEGALEGGPPVGIGARRAAVSAHMGCCAKLRAGSSQQPGSGAGGSGKKKNCCSCGAAHSVSLRAAMSTPVTTAPKAAVSGWMFMVYKSWRRA